MDRAALEQALQATNAGDMRDRELLQWLRAAEEWLPAYSQHIDVCLLLLRVLCTFPWGRFTGADKSTGSTTTSSRRTIAKMMGSFERLCCALVDRSAQLMVPALEAAMKPFAVSGVRNAIPLDTITRIINHCAAAYPSPQSINQLFVQALDPLCPAKRWGCSLHHECYVIVLLNLALEAHIPPGCTLVGNFKELTAATACGGGIGAGGEGSSLFTPHSTPMMTPAAAALDASGGSDAARGLCSAAGGIRGVLSNSDANSDATKGSGFVSSSYGGGGSDAVLQLSGHNRLMGQQIRLVGLVLTKLMEMEIGIEHEDDAIEAIVDERRRRKRSRKEARRAEHHHSHHAAHQQQAAPASSSSSTSAAAALLADFNGAGQFAYEHQDPNGHESPIHMLRMCVARVYARLAAEMRHRRAIGARDRPSWWGEVQAFHIDCVSKIKNPIALHHLAPSLALLGEAGEATELMHKVVSAALKGVSERRPSAVAAAAASAAARTGHAAGMGMGMGRMVPPPSSEKLSPKQRVWASAHIAPLFSFLYNRNTKDRQLLAPDTCQGLVRRLFKFVGSEGRTEGGGGGGAAMLRHAPPLSVAMTSLSTSSAGDGVVDSVLGHVLGMCRTLGWRWDEADDLPTEVRARVVAQFEALSAAAGSARRGHHRNHNNNNAAAAAAASAASTASAAAAAAAESAVESAVETDVPANTNVNANMMSRVCSAYVRSGKVRLDLYTSRCPWDNSI